jgi:hypothetical protein
MIKHPANKPADPSPATALPTTSIVDVVAAPESKEPAIDIAFARRKTRFTEKSLNAFPKTN